MKVKWGECEQQQQQQQQTYTWNVTMNERNHFKNQPSKPKLEEKQVALRMMVPPKLITIETSIYKRALKMTALLKITIVCLFVYYAFFLWVFCFLLEA